MPIIEGISKDAAKALIDELAAKYPPEILNSALLAAVEALVDGIKGRKVTITIE